MSPAVAAASASSTWWFRGMYTGLTLSRPSAVACRSDACDDRRASHRSDHASNRDGSANSDRARAASPRSAEDSARKQEV